MELPKGVKHQALPHKGSMNRLPLSQPNPTRRPIPEEDCADLAKPIHNRQRCRNVRPKHRHRFMNP